MSERALAGWGRLAPLAMAALLVGCPRPDPLPLLDSGAEGDAPDTGALDVPAVDRDVPDVGPGVDADVPDAGPRVDVQTRRWWTTGPMWCCRRRTMGRRSARPVGRRVGAPARIWRTTRPTAGPATTPAI